MLFLCSVYSNLYCITLLNKAEMLFYTGGRKKKKKEKVNF